MNIYQALKIAAQHDAYQSQVLAAVLVALYGVVVVGIFSCLDVAAHRPPVSREAAIAVAVIKSAFWPITLSVWITCTIVKCCLIFARGIADLVHDRLDRRTKRREPIPKMTAKRKS